MRDMKMAARTPRQGDIPPDHDFLRDRRHARETQLGRDDALVHYTIHDKGIVMGQGTVFPDANGAFTLVYDAEALHQIFSMISLTAHEGKWEGLADEVSINLLAVGSPAGPRAATVTLIGEEIFLEAADHLDAREARRTAPDRHPALNPAPAGTSRLGRAFERGF